MDLSPTADFSPSKASMEAPLKAPPILARAWEDVQRKTFTKWINNKLQSRNIQVENLAENFTDGTVLINLLEVIGDESLGKYNKAPKLRLQKIENMNAALRFIKSRNVQLHNIGAEDIVDGNEKLILGMIWTIILRFTIADISEEGLTAKEGLLLWCQRKTAGYKDVNVKDFTNSWQDGLALCALIHRHRPDLLQFNDLDKSNRHANTALAFDLAEKDIGIAKLLDVEDLCDTLKPDERSVMTYVAQYFHAFASLDKIERAGRRITTFAGALQQTFDMQHDYEQRARVLIDSIQGITTSWEQATFNETYADAKAQSNEFAQYKVTSKRSWVAEKFELDALLGNIQTKLKTYNLAPYQTPADLDTASVERAWNGLLKAESTRRKAINAKMAEIKENLRVGFANVAESLIKEINSISSTVAGLTGDLETQLQTTKDSLTRVSDLQARLSELEGLERACTEANIEENDHTVYSVEDISFDVALLAQTVQKKIAFIDNQIVARSLSNVTPQQLEEFETTFHHFDKDQSNSLNDYEFKACLASLGNALSDAEAADLFSSVSQGSTSVNFEQFTKYMISVTEDKTTPEQIQQSFKTLSGKEYIAESDLLKAQVPAETVAFLKTILPQVQDGYAYQEYLQKAFVQ